MYEVAATHRPASEDFAIKVRVAGGDREIALAGALLELLETYFADVGDAGKLRALRLISDRIEEESGVGEAE